MWCLYCERSTRNQLYIDDSCKNGLHCHFRRCIFSLDWKMNNCLVIYYATLVDFLPYLIEAKSLKLKAVLGCLMVLIPWIASVITSVARGRYIMHLMHLMAHIKRGRFYLSSKNLNYIYLFIYFLDTIVFQTYEVYTIVFVLLSWGNITN